jgi:5-methylcytosine-specific restriction endonuclease McrA
MTLKAKSSTAGSTQVATATERAPVAVTKPTFTRPSAGANRRYVASKSKTDSGVLHQPRTLKAPAADKARDRSETGGGRGASRTLAGNMVEMSGAAHAAPVTGTRSRGAESVGRKADNDTQGRVFVLGKGKQPLMPCHPARARALLREKKAVIHRLFPLVIRLKQRASGATQPVVVKLDPGARTTGVALVRADATNPRNQHVLFTAELEHRGSAIRDALTQRAAFRRSRRNRKTRYRAPRFLNRGGDKTGWLPPSLRHRLETTASWTARFRLWSPVTALAAESVRFDTQLMQNPEIAGVEYQQGELAGSELREYLLEKWGRKCAYCDAEHVPLNLDHIVARARQGSNRASNLALSCVRCNQVKGASDVQTFLRHDPKRLAKVLAHAKTPLAAAAAVNATRNALVKQLAATRLVVETATGGRTKWNRTRFGLPKSHALDAACVGAVDRLSGAGMPALSIRCMGRGSHQRTRLTAAGFPRGYLTRQKTHFGFRTGDLVCGNVPSGKKRGVHRGRVAVRARGFFNIQTKCGTVDSVSHRHLTILQRSDGYAYRLHTT